MIIITGTLHARADTLAEVLTLSREHVQRSRAEPGCLEAALGYYRAMSGRTPPALRGQIAVPTVSFAGEHDIISTRAYEKARGCFTGSYEVVQMPGGHFMHREHPAHFARELVRVLHDKAPI